MYPTLTSPSNPRIKSAIRLQNARHRRLKGRFLIDGIREIHRVIESWFSLLEVFLAENALETSSKPQELKSLLDLLSQKKVLIWSLPPFLFEKMAFGDRNEGIVAVAKTEVRSLQEIVFSENPLVAVIEKIEKPGNLGAILRSADGAGIEAVFIADPLCDLFNPNTIRSSLGTVFRIPCVVDTTENIFHFLRERSICIAAARCDGFISYSEHDFRKPTAIVLGSEAEGLSAQWKGESIPSLYLPMQGIADSLNVSTAAAVLFYEARRQRDESRRTGA